MTPSENDHLIQVALDIFSTWLDHVGCVINCVPDMVFGIPKEVLYRAYEEQQRGRHSNP